MTWLKLDVGFFGHPKALAAGRDGRDLWLAALCWAAQHETDGLIPAHALTLIGALAGVPDIDQAASRLVECGLWDNDPEGWRVHNYGAWQLTRETRDTARARDRQRKRERSTDSVRIPPGNQLETAQLPPGSREAEKRREEKRRHHQSGPEFRIIPSPPVDDDDDHTTKAHQALTHLADLLAREAKAKRPSSYAAAIIKKADQLPTLTQLAASHPDDTTLQLAQRWLAQRDHPSRPQPCNTCTATTHTTSNCPLTTGTIA